MFPHRPSLRKARTLHPMRGALTPDTAQWRKAGNVVSTGSLSEVKQWAPTFQTTPPEICAEALKRILGSHERPIIEATARAKLERILRYYDEVTSIF